jgi:diguanylate cyclase (GGDEF)-like protein/PAS domain S-box-containing protein
MSVKILLIQADVAGVDAVRKALQHSDDEHFDIESIRTFTEAQLRLAAEASASDNEEHPVAAVLLDLTAAEDPSVEAVDRVMREAPQIPLLILCMPADEAIAREAVRRGAQDYLLKGRLDTYLLPKALHNMLDRAAIADALFNEKERAQITLNAIGDGVLSTDIRGNVTYMNTVAESLTGWTREEAMGQPAHAVFRILDTRTRTGMESPLDLAIRENKTLSLTADCLLICRDGTEAPIEDSAAPIHDRRGKVIGAVIVFHDVTATRTMLQRMSHLAQHDGLTDLPNRLLFNDRLNQAIALAQRHETRLAVMFIDLDRFKYVNDSLGHAMGDRVLQSVAQRLLSCVRKSDTVSRQGGDEFVVLLTEVAHDADAAHVAEEILRALRVSHRLDNQELHLTVSIGIVTYPDDGSDADTLLRNADFAMYQAKGNGRDNYEFFQADMNSRAMARQSLENDLHHALQRREFFLHYQPKIDLETGAICGAEALLRWRHPQRGLVSPTQFIPVAEESGLIVPIGQWVLREACRQLEAWHSAGLANFGIAVNTSSVELRSRTFVDSLIAILEGTGIEPRHLQLELTETFLMQDSTSTAAVLNDIRSLGVAIALDDFGTGYSSLSYLKRFPIDTLKIDRSFVEELITESDSASIVNAVIAMGKSLRMRVVAEGVETREQLQFLQEHCCPEGQGYFFSRPIVAGEFTQLLRLADRLLPELQR